MTDRIPLAAIQSQTLTVALGTQPCRIQIDQKSTGLYFSLWVADVPIVASMLCRDRVSLVRHSYLGFVGALAFVDTQGTQDPEYTGLGTRYQLAYLP